MIRIFFGSPGCGKTTLGVRTLVKFKKKRKPPFKYMYANFDQQLVPSINLTGLGSWTLPFDSYLFIDEAGIEFNNRNFKNFPSELLRWFKLHRHYGIRCIDVISQSWEDMDIVVRRLADELWYVKKLGPFTLCRRIFKDVRVDKEKHQIVDGYRVSGFFSGLLPWNWGRNWFIFLRCFYYRFFDTHEAPHLTVRDFSNLKPADPPSWIQWQKQRLSALFEKFKPLPEPAPESSPPIDESLTELDDDAAARWLPDKTRSDCFCCNSCGWSVPTVIALNFQECPSCRRKIFLPDQQRNAESNPPQPSE